ncbi:MAG: M28 family peptidase [Armatimonadetes bacterium]|nr:M28 family peptidase [Armatimonadota bacterium]
MYSWLQAMFQSAPAALLFLASLGAPSALSARDGIYGEPTPITPTRLRAHLEFVADDLMEGRDTPSRGLDTTALYISTQLKLWGVKPGGDNGSYFQFINLGSAVADAEKTTMKLAGQDLKFGEDFVAQGSTGQANGKMVFVGQGWMIKEKGIDPYKGVDVKGKLLLVAGGQPTGFRRIMRAGKEGVDFLSPESAVKLYGAKGIVRVASDVDLAGWDRLSGKTPPRASGPSAKVADVPLVIVKPEAMQKALTSQANAIIANNSPTPPSAAIDADVSYNVVMKPVAVRTENVVAIIPGSDPTLKAEYVAFGAHMDHVGMGGNGPDKIFNGADDDGSGTVSILEICHAFATGPKPKRSMLFVWHCGEEKGLWGSSYFTNNPTVPIDKIVAQLNIDMIGRSRKPGDTNAANKMLTGPNEIYVVGSKRMSDDLYNASVAANNDLYKLQYNYHYDEPNDPESIFTRSDHYNYAVKGIPIIFWFDGVHEDYHRPGDEVSKIDFEKMAKVARTVYGLGFRLGNDANRPKVLRSATGG